MAADDDEEVAAAAEAVVGLVIGREMAPVCEEDDGEDEVGADAPCCRVAVETAVPEARRPIASPARIDTSVDPAVAPQPSIRPADGKETVLARGSRQGVGEGMETAEDKT